jgi:hypothetical protein
MRVSVQASPIARTRTIRPSPATGGITTSRLPLPFLVTAITASAPRPRRPGVPSLRSVSHSCAGFPRNDLTPPRRAFESRRFSLDE